MAAFPVTLRVEWTISEDAILAEYVLHNGSGARLLLFDRLFETDRAGARTVQPDRAYARLLPGGTLVVEKLVAPIPRDRDVESPEVPYARLVEPDRELGGQAVVAVPVALRPAYGPGAPAMPPGAAASALVLRLGCATVNEDVDARHVEAGGERLHVIRHAWAATHQRILESAPWPVAPHIPLAGG